MKSFLLTLLLFLPAQFSFAQYKEADSLKRELRVAKQDSARATLLMSLCISYVYTYPDSAVKYGEQTLRLDQKDSLKIKENELKTREVNILNAMGEAVGVKGDYARNLAIQLKALKVAESIHDGHLIHRSLFFIGISYIHAHNYQTALNYFYKVKAAGLLKHDEDDVKFIDHKTTDIRYMYNKELNDAFIGGCFLDLNKLDSAEYFIQRSYQIDLKVNVHSGLPYALMGILCTQKGQYKQALYYTRISLNFGHLNFMKIDRYTEFANTFHKMGATDSAVYYAKKVIQLGRHLSIGEEIILASQTLTEIYTAKHETDSAFKYQGMLLAAKDSLFSREKVLGFQDIAYKEAQRQEELATAKQEIINRIRIYILIGIVAVFFLVGVILWRNNRQKQKANVRLNQQKEEVQSALSQLKSTQTQLIQSEKMASLGELTAGIAHEIQNPLNFVNNFSEVSVELLEELKEEAKAGHNDDVIAIAGDLTQNLEKISHHGKRADAIVKGMLQHSQSGSGTKEPTNINALADECMRLAYHGLRAKDKSFNADLVTHFDESLPKINVIPQDMVRVMLNLFNNAFYAVGKKQKTAGADYTPEVSVTTSSGNGQVTIKVKDNGNGIPDAIKEKIMQPFFTTKPTGEGTGLGLSLSYDIVVKGHGGSILVNSVEGEGSEFIIQLPTN
jgi:two-component system NtrC family sensor kinase